MIIMILTNIKNPTHLLEMLNKLSTKYNGLHYKMTEIGYEVYINNSIETVPQGFDQYLKDIVKEINTELSISKIASVAFLPLVIKHFRDDLFVKFNNIEDKSVAIVKGMCTSRYHSFQKRVEEYFAASSQKKQVSQDPFSHFSHSLQRPTFGNPMSSPMHTRGISGMPSARPIDAFDEERKKQIDFQNAQIMAGIELGMQKENEEQIAMAEQEKTLITFFKLVDDFKSGKVKEANLVEGWIKCFNLNMPNIQFIECAEEKEQEAFLKFKCLLPPKRFEETDEKKLWIDINSIHSQIKKLIFKGEAFGCERKVESFNTKNFSINLTSLVVHSRSKEAIIRDLQLALISAGLESNYMLSDILCKSKPLMENKPTTNQSSANGVGLQPESKVPGDVTDDDEVDFLEKTTKEVINQKNLVPLSGVAWSKVSNQNDQLIRRVRGFRATNPGLFQPLKSLAEGLEDKGIANSILVGENEKGDTTSMLLRVNLRGKH